MRGERFVALGLAHARSPWFSELARWSTSAAIPVEFVKCITTDEVRARLASGRPFSAFLVDGALPGVDRDLIDEVRSCGCAVIVIDDGRVRRDWIGLGASTVLPSALSRADLLDALELHAVTISRSDVVPADVSNPPVTSWRGRLIAVLGAGGVGTSTAAIALAQGLGGDLRYGGLVLLADLALDADQAMLHDAGDVVPGIQELVDAHRNGDPSASDLRSLTFDVVNRQYQLLLGLRRHRDWVSIRPRAFAAALDGMRRAYRAVVADIAADLEGEDQSGSIDLEDRNLFARSVTAHADIVVVVGLPGPKGLHRVVRVVDALLEHQVLPSRIVPVINRAPRSPRARSELSSAYAQLAGTRSQRGGLAGPIFLPERRHLDDIISDSARMPPAMCAPLTSAVSALLDRLAKEPSVDSSGHDVLEPVAVVPGSLGSWSDESEPPC